MKNYKFTLQGLDCPNCAKRIENRVASKEEYKDVIVNFSNLSLSFKTDKEERVEEDIKKIVKEIEPDIKIVSNNKEKNEGNSRTNKDIIRLVIGVGLYFLGILLNFSSNIMLIITIISVSILLYKTLIKSIKQFKNKILDENTLIVISVIGACLVNKVFEGIMVITLYEIGKILEAKAVNRTRKSISKLMDIKPEYANLKENNNVKKISPEDVCLNSVIVIKTGEKIPLDGEIVYGNAKIDNSALTGESKLIDVKVGDKVLSGGINIEGLIEVRVEKTYENSTVSQILNLVENATDKKAKTETLVSKMARIYTPTVLILAILVAIFMPILFNQVTYSQSIYKALILLVISCPCSIAISVPLSYFSGIGKSSKNGILVKGSDFLDGFKNIKEIIFDKTGTITTGDFIVKSINVYNQNYTAEKVLELFALGESFSNHPIAKSILKKWNKEMDKSKVMGYREIPGEGIEYKLDDKKIKIGRKEFTGNDACIENEVGTVIYLKVEEETVGSIILTDEIKSDAKDVINKLTRLGIRTKMFTGDSKEIALDIANKIGIEETKYEMLPQEKYKELENEISGNKKNGLIAFVGDGINDSPVLARADIGISMGGIGSNSAIEASDIVIMNDELSKILEEIDISKKTTKVIKQNLLFAIGVKLLVLILSLLGVSTMWEAVFADVGTTLITILNTLRILR